MSHGGKWIFKSTADGSTTSAYVEDTSPSKIAAAIAAAATVLSVTPAEIIFGDIHRFSQDSATLATGQTAGGGGGGGAEGLHP